MSFSLLLLNGPSPGLSVRLRQGEVAHIGRHHSCELQIEGDQVSRQHARVLQRGDTWFLEDCGSTNGSLINSQRVEASPLSRGDLIRIGERLILFVDNEQTDEAIEFRSSLWKVTTMIGRPPSEGTFAPLVQKGLSGAVSRVVKDSAVLCRLANELHRNQSLSQLFNVVANAIADGMGADRVVCWRIGTDGKLHCVGCRGANPEDMKNEVIFARLAVDRKKAIFFPSGHTIIKETMPPGGHVAAAKQAAKMPAPKPSDIGRKLCVPIPGYEQCLGAIECHRSPSHPPFDRSDLDFVMVVAYQTGLAVENLEHRERLQNANAELKQQSLRREHFVGKSQVIQELLEQVACVAPAESTVLILGESGTGKELIAKTIHESSRRTEGPYVIVNCASPSESLLESELFGHEAGAFTGADRKRIGQFERAHRGTLFLDEIGEMSLNCQAKLLRILEGHPFERVGGEDSIHVDVRILAATHRNLLELVKQKKFREDLYYRLRVVDLTVPPLREREDDAVLLAVEFLKYFCNKMGTGPKRLSEEARILIETYQWPGNVRQLKNCIERAVVLGKGAEVLPDDLGIITEDATRLSPFCSLREAEKAHIERILKHVGGNKTAACKILGIGRGTLYSKLENFRKNERATQEQSIDTSKTVLASEDACSLH